MIQVCNNRSGEINPTKIRELVEGYIKKIKYYRKKENVSSNLTSNAVMSNSSNFTVANNSNSNNISSILASNVSSSSGGTNNIGSLLSAPMLPPLLSIGPGGGDGSNPPAPGALLNKASALAPLTTIKNKA